MNNNVKAGHKNKQSYANTRTTGKEQYYTNKDVVDLCLKEVQKHIDLTGRTILEPCGGTGEFIEGFQRIGIPTDDVIAFDIEPKHLLVKKGDYLKTDLSAFKNLISITNPPFGRASSLAKQFFNHATQHSEYICYLVPRSWRKWTVHNSLDKNFHLIADIEMPKNCFYLSDGGTKEADVLNTVFQIWQRRDYQRKIIKIPDHKLIKKITPKQKKAISHKKIKKQLFELVDNKSIPMVILPSDGTLPTGSALQSENCDDSINPASLEICGLIDNDCESLIEPARFIKFETDCYEKYIANRPDSITGVNFEIIVFGHSCGKCKEITETTVDAKTTTMYLKIDRDDVKEALKQIDYSKYYKNVSYVSALSIQEINYELNEWFGLENFKF